MKFCVSVSPPPLSSSLSLGRRKGRERGERRNERRGEEKKLWTKGQEPFTKGSLYWAATLRHCNKTHDSERQRK
jgi:hypothetical protein